MTSEQTAIARRLVACEQWRWMPGMRSCWAIEPTEGPFWCRVTTPRSIGLRGDGSPECNPNCFPDLTDPATCGCLLAMLSEAGSVDLTQLGDHWYAALWIHEGQTLTAEAEAPALGEALALALLACWGAE